MAEHYTWRTGFDQTGLAAFAPWKVTIRIADQAGHGTAVVQIGQPPSWDFPTIRVIDSPLVSTGPAGCRTVVNLLEQKNFAFPGGVARLFAGLFRNPAREILMRSGHALRFAEKTVPCRRRR